MLSPRTTYSPKGTSSTPSSMLYTRSVLSDKMTLVVWSNPSSLPCCPKNQLPHARREGGRTNDDGPAVLSDYEDLLCRARGGGETRERRRSNHVSEGGLRGARRAERLGKRDGEEGEVEVVRTVHVLGER